MLKKKLNKQNLLAYIKKYWWILVLTITLLAGILISFSGVLISVFKTDNKADLTQKNQNTPKNCNLNNNMKTFTPTNSKIFINKTDEINAPDVVELEDGLQYQAFLPDTETDNNNSICAKGGDSLSMIYIGKFPDGEIFDSNADSGRTFEFTLGSGMVISGWDKGLVGIQEEERRILYIPYQLAYGERGIPGAIPPKADLIFEVQAIKITPSTE